MTRSLWFPAAPSNRGRVQQCDKVEKSCTLCKWAATANGSEEMGAHVVEWRQDGEGNAAMRDFCPHADKWWKACQKLSAFRVIRALTVIHLVHDMIYYALLQFIFKYFPLQNVHFRQQWKKQQQQQKDSLFYHWSYILPEINLFCDKIFKCYDHQSYSSRVRSAHYD